MNKRRYKEIFIVLHITLCLLALSGEPINSSIKAILIYYGIVIINLGVAAILINKHMRRYYHEKVKDINS